MYKIAISGKKKSGKNTFANILTNKLNKNFNCLNISFAEPIKEIAKIAFPQIELNWLYGESELRETIVPYLSLNESSVSVRDILIDLGEILKKYDKNIWIHSVNHKANEFILNNEKPVVLVTDIRFTNEFKFLKNNNYTCIRIKRNNVCNENQNETEIDQDLINDNEFDFVINNNFSLEKLEEMADEVLLSILT